MAKNIVSILMGGGEGYTKHFSIPRETSYFISNVSMEFDMCATLYESPWQALEVLQKYDMTLTDLVQIRRNMFR